MKKQLLTILATGTIGAAFAQLPVSTTPSNKNIVLEEFTGIHCGYCPDGHTVANNIYNNNPGRVVLINIHSGGFATASNGEPDFKTTMGNAIDAMPGMGITGYPAGAVNRTVLTGSVMAAGRGSWTTMANTIKNQSAYCNVAVEANVDAATRVLTYTAQVYYTATSPATTNSLTVMLLEDKVFGIQDNYGSPTPYNAANYNADGSYNHNHVLRRGLTAGNFGITIPVTTVGTTFTTTGSYTVPTTFGAVNKTTPCNLGNLELAAFVTETNVKTINGAYGPVNLTNIPYTNDAAVSALIADAEVCAGNLQPMKFTLTNNGSANITSATINYGVVGGSTQNHNFVGNLAPFTSTVVMLPAYSFAASATNTLNVTVTNVNGSADQNAVNDAATKSIPLTNKIANTPGTMSMIFKSDQYGSELTWEVKEEISGTVVASGGPYTDLGASGTTTHPAVNFAANPNMCYKTVIYDSYGDGYNAGTGVGGYTITSGGVNVYTKSSAFSNEDVALWKTANTTGISEAINTVYDVSVYPNPAKNSSAVSIVLTQNETISVNVVNAVGQVVFSETLTNLAAGSHSVKLNSENWANGLYNVNVSTANGTVSRKLVVSK